MIPVLVSSRPKMSPSWKATFSVAFSPCANDLMRFPFKYRLTRPCPRTGLPKTTVAVPDPLSVVVVDHTGAFGIHPHHSYSFEQGPISGAGKLVQADVHVAVAVVTPAAASDSPSRRRRARVEGASTTTRKAAHDAFWDAAIPTACLGQKR
eukprot:9476036-Pyramimonas_sp.AAC.1